MSSKGWMRKEVGSHYRQSPFPILYFLMLFLLSDHAILATQLFLNFADAIDQARHPDCRRGEDTASSGGCRRAPYSMPSLMEDSLVMDAMNVNSSTTTNVDTNNTSEKKSNKSLLVGVPVGTGLIVVLVGLTWVFLCLQRRSFTTEEDHEEEEDAGLDDELEDGRGPRRFLYTELVDATENFHSDRKLGEGGFGPVYKGVLSNPQLDVAIKRISSQSKQGRKEYISEVKIISQLRHRNLVQLIGWCHQANDFLLVYELMPNGSLDSHLFNPKDRILSWPTRYNVALGLAAALLYLHDEWEQCVVHRDVKSSNVLLDADFNAKLGDFGLARLSKHGNDLQTTFFAGTMGYLAPECVISGKASKESDVYSFGMVALEIACGRRCIERTEEEDKVRLVEWVWEMYGKGMLLETIDDRLDKDFDGEQIRRLMMVGLWCAHPDPNQRPHIRQAIGVLNLELPIPKLPLKMPLPMYIWSSTSFNKEGDATTSSTMTTTTNVFSQDTSSNNLPTNTIGASSSSSFSPLLRVATIYDR